mmetsp:Transcript_57798/g.122604  ORF Transcript_57798/g.122604 Transcript_57798/m.122604 type:complete len:113 (-) Transcript_57798:187-525(-)
MVSSLNTSDVSEFIKIKLNSPSIASSKSTTADEVQWSNRPKLESTPASKYFAQTMATQQHYTQPGPASANNYLDLSFDGPGATPATRLQVLPWLTQLVLESAWLPLESAQTQ